MNLQCVLELIKFQLYKTQTDQNMSLLLLTWNGENCTVHIWKSCKGFVQGN
uniref:Uncharacterized protein n=1 Tax=Arundo donax TaxID=35708 RepID=A0A0A9B375_ARUDO